MIVVVISINLPFQSFHRWYSKDSTTSVRRQTLPLMIGPLIALKRNRRRAPVINSHVVKHYNVFPRMICVIMNQIVVMVLMRMSQRSAKDTPSMYNFFNLDVYFHYCKFKKSRNDNNRSSILNAVKLLYNNLKYF